MIGGIQFKAIKRARIPLFLSYTQEPDGAVKAAKPLGKDQSQSIWSSGLNQKLK